MHLVTCSHLEFDLSVSAIRSREDSEDPRVDVKGLHGLVERTLVK